MNLKQLCAKLISLINKLFIFIILGLRPILGPATCKYELSCGKFAVYQLQHEPFHKALWQIMKRVLSCGPLPF